MKTYTHTIVIAFLLMILASPSATGQKIDSNYFLTNYLISEKLIERYSGIGFGLTGSRHIKEFDLYDVLYYNSAGPNYQQTEWFETKYKQSYYSLFSFKAFAHAVTPFTTIRKVGKVHLDLGAEIFGQWLVMPSTQYNTISSSSHYDVFYNNKPGFINTRFNGALWINEQFAIGGVLQANVYYMKTNDDRVFQKDIFMTNYGFAPQLSYWHTLKGKTPQNNWHFRFNTELFNWWDKSSLYRSVFGELEVFKVSKKRSDKFWGLFIQYHDIRLNPGKSHINTGYRFIYDRQWLFGIQFGGKSI